MWWMAIQAGISAYQSNEKGRAIQDQNYLEEARAGLQNGVRTARNAVSASQDALARWSQSVNNRLALESGAGTLEANTVNAVRRGNARTQARFSQSLSDVEQAGGAQAARGASGVAGQVTDTIARTMALRAGIVREQFRRAGLAEDDDTRNRAGIIMSQMMHSLDGGIIHPTLDYNVNQPQKIEELSQLSMYGGAAMTLFKGYAGDAMTQTDGKAPTFTWNFQTDTTDTVGIDSNVG